MGYIYHLLSSSSMISYTYHGIAATLIRFLTSYSRLRTLILTSGKTGPFHTQCPSCTTPVMWHVTVGQMVKAPCCLLNGTRSYEFQRWLLEWNNIVLLYQSHADNCSGCGPRVICGMWNNNPIPTGMGFTISKCDYLCMYFQGRQGDQAIILLIDNAYLISRLVKHDTPLGCNYD